MLLSPVEQIILMLCSLAFLKFKEYFRFTSTTEDLMIANQEMKNWKTNNDNIL